nr:MAG TPA: hypothetical protein [Crassvirales sp.]
MGKYSSTQGFKNPDSLFIKVRDTELITEITPRNFTWSFT